MNSKWFLAVLLFLSLYFCLFSFQKIDLVTADIGRHVKNGEIFLHSAEYGVSKSEILHTNFFSYTHSDFPFINHHWGSGVLAYLIFAMSGFSGLSVVYFLLLLLALTLSILTVRGKANLSALTMIGFFLAPLIASRMEVRPEAVSYLFVAFFIFVLFQNSEKRLSQKWLFVLPLVQLLWVNMHIYFIFGPFLVGVFLFENLIRKNWPGAKKLATVLGLTTLASLVSPYGIVGAIYPLTIFQNYGYRIVENQSIPFLEHLGMANPNFLWFKIALTLVILSSIFVWFKKRSSFSLSLVIISLTFAVLAFLGIRNIALFALVSLPLLSLNFSVLQEKLRDTLDPELKPVLMILLGFVMLISVFVNFKDRLPWNRDFGIGLSSGSLDSLQFIKQTGIRGPIFNNYDIGGAMIFGMYPGEKVFVDNRPEAYPADFFNKVYIPMQEDETVWQKTLAEYDFNAIFFYRLDYTPWSQTFLLARVKDTAWAPVYVDTRTIIFLRRNEVNREVIEKYELPEDTFSYTQE